MQTAYRYALRLRRFFPADASTRSANRWSAFAPEPWVERDVLGHI